MNLSYTVSDKGYTIFRDGVPWIVQDGYIPYPGETIEESAQNHIDQILADQAAADEAAQQPTIEERVETQEQAIAELSILIAGGVA
ncbi:hypothetical protein [Caproiciproducens faecalis]|uniref:Uncharacterized protein n=1 Tax=Caproiciproducens faecalis TaxID=2820301 RepID=A0ABS7DRK0_9FIRM|nr:hypothetical protein [Caproiciproducens faecalis]MBW7573926.1 hypothetical protein [Caproiciproducens faecalis]